MMKKFVIILAIVSSLVGGVLSFVIIRNESKIGNISSARHSGSEVTWNQDHVTDEVLYRKTVANLNDGWANVRSGNTYFKEGRYDEGVEAYKRAYEVDPGNRVYTGDLLIEAYEKTGRYDEAISLVDEILKSQRLVEYGINRFSTIRARLLAAKKATQKA